MTNICNQILSEILSCDQRKCKGVIRVLENIAASEITGVTYSGMWSEMSLHIEDLIK